MLRQACSGRTLVAERRSHHRSKVCRRPLPVAKQVVDLGTPFTRAQPPANKSNAVGKVLCFDYEENNLDGLSGCDPIEFGPAPARFNLRPLPAKSCPRCGCERFFSVDASHVKHQRTVSQLRDLTFVGFPLGLCLCTDLPALSMSSL